MALLMQLQAAQMQATQTQTAAARATGPPK